MKQQTEKAKYNICGVILSRKHAATSGLSMHLYRVHKNESFEKLQQNQVRNFISFQLTKKTNSVY